MVMKKVLKDMVVTLDAVFGKEDNG